MNNKKIEFLIAERLDNIKQLREDIEHFTKTLKRDIERLKFHQSIIDDLKKMKKNGST